jgi:hypothetical protein
MRKKTWEKNQYIYYFADKQNIQMQKGSSPYLYITSSLSWIRTKHAISKSFYHKSLWSASFKENIISDASLIYRNFQRIFSLKHKELNVNTYISSSFTQDVKRSGAQTMPMKYRKYQIACNIKYYQRGMVEIYDSCDGQIFIWDYIHQDRYKFKPKIDVKKVKSAYKGKMYNSGINLVWVCVVGRVGGLNIKQMYLWKKKSNRHTME